MPYCEIVNLQRAAQMERAKNEIEIQLQASHVGKESAEASLEKVNLESQQALANAQFMLTGLIQSQTRTEAALDVSKYFILNKDFNSNCVTLTEERELNNDNTGPCKLKKSVHRV